MSCSLFRRKNAFTISSLSLARSNQMGRLSLFFVLAVSIQAFGQINRVPNTTLRFPAEPPVASTNFVLNELMPGVQFNKPVVSAQFVPKVQRDDQQSEPDRPEGQRRTPADVGSFDQTEQQDAEARDRQEGTEEVGRAGFRLS